MPLPLARFIAVMAYVVIWGGYFAAAIYARQIFPQLMETYGKLTFLACGFGSMGVLIAVTYAIEIALERRKQRATDGPVFEPLPDSQAPKARR